jgi:ribosome-binding protein aMBF1 (putative translation factor)
MKKKNVIKKDYRYFDDWLKDQLQDSEFRREYEKVQVEFAPIRAILEARMKKGMTQAQIAKKMGTTQSSIARVESGKSHPTIPFLQRLADATGTRLSIRFLSQ